CDGYELRIDVLGWSVVIACLGIDAVRRLADPECHAAARVPAQRGGSRVGQGLAGGYESASAVEPPPKPGLRARCCGSDDGDPPRRAGVADVSTTAADEICPKMLTAQLEAVIAGHDEKISGGIEVTQLQRRPERLQRVALGKHTVPHELADDRIALI